MSDSRASGPRARPNLYTIPAGEDFLPVLADAVLGNRLDLGLGGDDPASLGKLTLYLPTRRAARAFAAVLLASSGRKALIMPRLVPLGDPADAELHDILSTPPDEAALAEDLAPIQPLSRQLLLARFIQSASARPRGADEAPAALSASSLGSAFALAADLAALLDAMQAEDVPYERLLKLDAARFDEFWQVTARFLDILGKTWPDVLRERGEVDPVSWRNRLLDARSARLRAGGVGDPVIVAGSTGSMPATARLIAAVARQQRGAVVLPDLDLDAPDAQWSALGAEAQARPDRAASHPQAMLARLLHQMEAVRDDVRSLFSAVSSPGRNLRRSLAHEALRAPASTEAWRDLEARLPAASIAVAMADVTLVEAPDERMEGLTVALAIRRELDHPGRTVALVTPDRGLAERVALELGRWGVTVDDSAGQPLGRTLAGHAFSLLLALLESGVSSRCLLELLHHPGVVLGLAPEKLAAARRAFEIGALRGARPFTGLEGLRAAIAEMPERVANHRAPRPRRGLGLDEMAAAVELADRIEAALAPLIASASGAAFSLADAIRALREALERLAVTDDGEVAVYGAEDGQALQLLLDDLEAACADISGDAGDLARICRVAMAERVVRLRGREHPRVRLLGLIEARLMNADLVILGGLNEPIWPPGAVTDAFLNRAMRAELGLSSPERRVGQSAHDFIQAFAGSRVLLSRAAKAGGVLALPSRFWQRLDAVVPPDVWKQAKERGHEFVALAAALDAPAQVRAWRRPRPFPPAHLQPRRLSVTEVETLYRDPYAIHARRVLRLDPLEPMERELGASDRGQLLHGVMEAFARAWPSVLPPDPLAALLALGAERFRPVMHEPDVSGFWWPRFCALVPDIVAWERERRADLVRIGTELRIEAAIGLPSGGEIALSARADRIELRPDGSLAILDFKTGAPPSSRQIAAGLAPQLLLEAALSERASFVPAEPGDAQAPLGPATASQALYVVLKPVKSTLDTAEAAPAASLREVAREHLEGFAAMVSEFRSGTRPYTSRFAAQFMRFDGDYDHLARVKEWSAAGHDSDEEAS
jgi:ATP-dependent helicase/nuclease subunit B